MNLVQRVGTAAADAIEKFRAAAREFTEEYAWLQNNPPPLVAAPEIWRDYESLLSRSRIIGGTLQTVTRAIDAVLGTVWRTTGHDLAGAGLGAFPIVPVALVAGGTATLIAGINAIRQFRERLQVFEALTREGRPAAQAWREAAKATTSPNIVENVAASIAYVVAGTVILIMLLRRK